MFEYSFIQSSRNIQFIICIDKTHIDSAVQLIKTQDFIIFQRFHIFRLQISKIKMNHIVSPTLKKNRGFRRQEGFINHSLYDLSEWLYNMGQSRSKFSRCQFSVWSQNQCYIFR